MNSQIHVFQYLMNKKMESYHTSILTIQRNTSGEEEMARIREEEEREKLENNRSDKN